MEGNHEHSQWAPRNVQSRSESSQEQRCHENVNPSLSLWIKLQTEVKKFHDDDQICGLLKNRKGRWLPEEEEYAKFLVEEFEAGLSPNLEHGTTLRAYLSKKLFCSPMRISKKFTGKKVGTQVFMRKNHILPNSLLSYESQVRRRSLALEHKFLKAYISWESDRLTNNNQNHKQNINTKEPPKSEVKMPPKVLPCAPNFQTVQTRSDHIRPFHKIEGNSSKRHEHEVISNSLARKASIYVTHPRKSTPTHQIWPYQAPRDIPRPSVTFHDSSMLHSSSLLSSVMNETTTIPRRYVNPREIDVAKKNSSYQEDSDIPDLLSGFDQHSSATKQTSSEALQSVLDSRPMCTTWPKDSTFFAGVCGHESPYITSKSFDELHKFLGVGISSAKMSSLDLNANSIDKKKCGESSLFSPSAASIHAASLGCDKNPAASTIVSFSLSNQTVNDKNDSLQRMDASSGFNPQPTPEMIQTSNPSFDVCGLGNGGGAMREDVKISRQSHNHYTSSVSEVFGSMAPHQQRYVNSRYIQTTTAESDGKRRRRQYSEISTFFGNPQSQDNSSAKRMKAGFSSSQYSHAVSASEHSSDAGFDSDPPFSYH